MPEPLKRNHKDEIHPSAISALMAVLADNDGSARERARRSLVAIGKPAVTPLLEALRDRHEHVRWEAAKALSQINDSAAAPALVSALEDKSFGVRWLAAEGLIAMGRHGLLPLLQALMEGPDSAWLREGAHHVLRTLAGDENLHAQLKPLLAALEDVEPAVEIPRAAHEALDTFQRPKHE